MKIGDTMALTIMIQGTMSNVGKSLITAGLCRVFKQDGYTVAPFKSQNMALNSFITKNGLEMGRAQVMQAEAAGIEPEVSMNPILLKPTNDVGSQVIVNGEVIGTMSAKDYYKNKKKFIPDILNAFNELEKKYDIIVIEGAGSPAEINLKKDDIVNMGMAKLVKAPVLLVGDIDRGGVFAQLIGTVDLLEDDEKDYVKGLIVNKFRGDKGILKDGIDMLEEKAKKDVIGIVPYVNCDIDDEDSLSERFENKKTTGIINIAVIKLPKISNFTDFNVFESSELINLRYVKNVYELGQSDMVIIPGTKNTVSDLLWLRENGLEAEIKKLASKGKIVFGVCGGYQILGQKIIDFEETDKKGEFQGIGLLPIETIFQKDKIRTRVNGIVKNISGVLSSLSGEHFEGYEIHNGNSFITDSTAKNMNVLCEEFSGVTEEKTDGVNSENVYGTYVHGFFDSQNILEKIISSIAKQKGLDNTSIKVLNMREYKEKQYDILADTIRQNIDMNKIYKILKEGIKK